MYTSIVMDHFANPRNVGTIDAPDGYAQVKSTVHEDVVEVFLRIREGAIIDIKQRTFGCAAAIASSSFTTELVRGKPLSYAEALTEEDVSQALKLPEAKVQCSLLAVKAVHQAIERYLNQHPEPRAAEAGQSLS